MAADGGDVGRPSAAAGGDLALRVMLGLCTAVLLAGALHLAHVIFTPIAFALLTMALVWPVQEAARRFVPRPVALLLAILATLAVLVVLGSAAAWAFGGVARWFIANAAQLQALYAQKVAWLDARGVALGGVFVESFDARRLVQLAQGLLSQLQGIVTFIALTLVYVLLGLLEADAVSAQLRRIGATRPAALRILAGLRETAAKLRSYMMVRTLMSVLTGLVVWVFAEAMGLQLAEEWGGIAFVLNYLPFIGPLVATLLPTVIAALQFGTWQVALAVFLVLQVIQNTIGSYLEPRLAGARLALSPFMVLVAVFLGAFLWGIPGAFIGVPALIGALTLCRQFERSRWIAELLSGKGPAEA